MEKIEDQNRVFEHQKSDFLDILNKIDKKDPEEADIQKAKAMITSNPHLWEISMGAVGTTLNLFLEKISPNKNTKLFLWAELLSIKERLGYGSSCQIEKLIIDQIMYCWAGVIYMERQVSEVIVTSGCNRQNLDHWQNTLTRYQNRYLRAIETLARVRRLNKSIAFQVNIAADGGQQVNVNSDNSGGG